MLGHLRVLLRQRYPFFPLCVAACVGILIAPFVVGFVGVMVVWGVSLMCFMVAAWRGSVVVLLIGTMLSFCVLRHWQSDGSPAKIFAETLEMPVVAEGIAHIVSETQTHGDKYWNTRAKVLSLSVGEVYGTPQIRILLEGSGEPPPRGAVVRFRGTLLPIDAPRNPGEFDRKWFLQRAQIYNRVVCAAGEVVVKQKRHGLPALAHATHDWIVRTLTHGVDPEAPTSQFIIGMTTGNASGLSPSLAEDFRRTGTAHLFAVSGLHVGMLGLLLGIVLEIFRVPRRVIIVVVAPVLFYYAYVVGWKPASVRAAVMMAFVMGGILAGRPAVALNSLFAAAFLIWLADTNELFNAGFHLSFVVVGGLIATATPLTRIIRRPFEVDDFIPKRIYTPWEKWRTDFANNLAPTMAVSTIAWLVTIPLIAAIFHIVSLIALPANLICVPMAFVVMSLALMALVSAPISMGLAAVFNNANVAAAGVIVFTAEFLGALPFAALPVAAPAPPQITVLDFGRGGGAVIEVSGKCWLVDCGPRFAYQRTLSPFLRMRGIVRPAGLILTHGDTTRIGAAEQLLDAFPPRVIYENALSDRSATRRNFNRVLAERAISQRSLTAGNDVVLNGDATLRVLYPPSEVSSNIADDRALVLMATINGYRVLFLGDAGAATETWLLASGEDLRCDIIVKGIHHSGMAMDGALLDAARPSLVVAACADFPAVAQFAPETEEEIAMRNIRLLRQDRTGAVTIKFLPAGGYTVETFISD